MCLVPDSCLLSVTPDTGAASCRMVSLAGPSAACVSQPDGMVGTGGIRGMPTGMQRDDGVRAYVEWPSQEPHEITTTALHHD